MPTKNTPIPDEKLSTEAAAKIAGVNVRTIRDWLDAGKVAFDSIPYGSRTMRLVSRLSLEAYLISRQSK
jgi:hypothetical protein